MASFETIRPQPSFNLAGAATTMLGGFAAALTIVITLVLSSGSAHAQLNCDIRKSLLAKLDTGYGEQPVALGLASTGNVVELLISSGGSWTILITNPNGIACIAAVGEDWEHLVRKPAGESS